MASMNGTGMVQPQLPRFDGKNFEHWKIQMEVLFGFQELTEIVEEGFVEPETPAGLTMEEQRTIKENRKKDRKALFYIFQAIDSSIFEKVGNSKTTKEAWDSLIKIYKGVEKVQKVRLQTLRRQFELLQMEKSESISDYFSRTLALVNQMKANGETIGDQQIVEKILRTLTLQFEYIVTSIEESRDLSILTVDELIGSLQMHEQRLKEKSKIVEEALQSQLVLPDEKKNLSNQRKDKRWQEKHSGQRKDKSHIQCFNCKKYGHYQSDCRSKKIGGQKFHAKVARLVDSDDEHDNALLFTCDAMVENQKNVWYLGLRM